MSKSPRLLAQRRFLPLFVTQFLGATNDNLLRNALVVLLIFDAASWTSLAPGTLANLAAGVFILPMFLLSASAGQLADKFDKARLARLYKLMGIVAALIGAAGFWLHSVPVLMTALFLQGLCSALFGPIKYAILPQHLKAQELVGGNALIAAGTFVAILAGTLLGTLLASGVAAPAEIAVATLGIAVAGYVASRGIPAAPPPSADLRLGHNPVIETWRSMVFVRRNRKVFLAILGTSWFWLYGLLFLAQFPAYARNLMGGDESVVALLLLVFTLGIGVGSYACERLSAGRVDFRLVAVGSVGLTLFALDLAYVSPESVRDEQPLAALAVLAQAGSWRLLGDLALLGVCGGLFIVPLYALIQVASSDENRARTIGANNVFNALFMVTGALVAAGLLGLGLTIPTLFVLVALANAPIAAAIWRLAPELSQTPSAGSGGA